MLKEKFEQARAHVRENKKVYAVGAGCLGAGYLVRGGTPEIKQLVKARNIMLMGYKSPQTVNAILLAAKGDPGDVVQRLSDGKKWASKGDLARELSANRSMLTRYFRGDLPDLLGEQYKVIGKAGHEILV